MASHRFPLNETDHDALAAHLKFPAPIDDLCDAEIVELYAHAVLADAIGARDAQDGLPDYVGHALAGLHGDNIGRHLTPEEKARICDILEVTLDA